MLSSRTSLLKALPSPYSKLGESALSIILPGLVCASKGRLCVLESSKKALSMHAEESALLGVYQNSSVAPGGDGCEQEP
jgi:hypothetical protein